MARLLVGGAVILSMLTLGSSGPRQQAKDSFFSATPMKPSVVAALKAQHRAIPRAVPSSVNQGRKFNPTGGVIAPLVTAARQKVLVILVEFTTPPPGGPASRIPTKYFDNLLFGTKYDPAEYAAYAGHPIDRTLKNYYSKNSYGTVDVVTLNMPSKLGWAQSGKPYDYYCKGDGVHDYGYGPYPENAQGLVVDAIDAVDPFVDFSQYAVNGEVPNIFVVHAGSGAEWSGDTNVIWSHSWSVGWLFENGLTRDGVKIDNYAMMPEVGGDTTGFTGAVSGPYPPTVGVYAHEYGHVLGLPDQYDYGYESQGTGIFSLMAGGSWNTYPSYDIFSGNSPSSLDAWSKYRLGFVKPVEVTSSTEATLPAVETHPVVYKVAVPFSSGREYYLFENRQPVDFDMGLRSGTMHGMVIYHVDDTALTRTYWRPNEAENWKEFRSEGWQTAPNGETHYAISVIQADDQWHLEHGLGVGSQPDLYPGALGVTEFSTATSPNTSTYYYWPGSPAPFGWSHVKVTNIAESGGVVTATMEYEP
jgi:immune inhibitor A